MAYKHCPSCGGEIEFGYVFCVSCGARLDEPAAEPAPEPEPEAEESVGETAIVDLDAEHAFFSDSKPSKSRSESQTVMRSSPVPRSAPAPAPTVEPAPAPRPEPKVEAKIEPRVEPRVAAKAEPAPAPRVEAAPRPAPAPEAPRPAPRPAWEIKVQVLRTSTGEKGNHSFKADQVVLGRTEGDLTFPGDATLSSPHARLFVSGGRLMAEDLSSRNGLFHRVTQAIELVHGMRFLVGEQVLRFEYFNPVRILKQPDGTYFCGSAAPQWKFRLVQILKGGVEGNVYCYSTKVVTIGREDSDINYPDDRFISYQHALIEAKDGRYYLSDRGSRNGTYVQVDQPLEIAKGDIVAVGKALLRVDLEAA